MSTSTFTEIFRNLVLKSLDKVYQFTVAYGPKVMLAAVIFLIGWICAVLLKKITAKLFKALGFDVLSGKFGFKQFLEKGGIRKNPSQLVGLFFYWLIIFSTLVMIFETLELEAASSLIKQAVSYLPNIFVALILLALGIFLSGFVGRFVETTSQLANIRFRGVLSKAARYAVIGFVVMMVLEQLEVASGIVAQSFIIIFGILPLILFLLVLIGGRDIVSSVLAGRLVMNAYKKGDMIELESISGEIESIGFVATKLKKGTEEISVPNAEIVRRIVKKKSN